MLSGQTEPAKSKGAISGNVVDAHAGMPLAGYEVILTGGDSPSASITDQSGLFRFANLSAGTYTLTGRHPGTGGHVSKTLRLEPGQELKALKLAARSPASISGRVLDENGKPAAFVEVRLIGTEYVAGKLSHSAKESTNTDAAGRFTFTRNVETGRAYRVLAGHTEVRLPSKEDADISSAHLAPVATWFPDSLSREAAIPILLSEGERRDGLELHLRKAATFCLDYELRFNESPTSVHLNLKDQDGLPLPLPTSNPADYHYRYCGLPAGRFRISVNATVPPPSRVVSSMSEFSLVDRTVRVRAVAIPALVSVDAAWADPKGEHPPVDRVQVEFATAGAYMRSSFRMPGSFVVPVFISADFQLGVQFPRNAQGLYLKEATYGGADVLHHSVDLGSGVRGTVSIKIASDAGSLSARVTDDNGDPAADANVTIIPEDADGEGAVAAAMVTGQTDQSGMFVADKLPPATYRVVATARPIRPIPEDIAGLMGILGAASKVEVLPKARAQVTLKPVPLE